MNIGKDEEKNLGADKMQGGVLINGVLTGDAKKQQVYKRLCCIF